VLILPMLFGAFQPHSPHRADRLSPGPRTKNLLASCYVVAYIYILGSHTGTLYIGVSSNLYLRVSQQTLLSGFGGRKAPNSMGKISTAEVLRLRATSAVSRNQSVRRCAQDDDSVGV
jgi:predicted GIY-YIG superfamily endonuclease